MELLATSVISSATGKGRHTTIHREMVLMEGSGVLIDTPGVKLFGMTGEDNHSISEVMDIRQFEGKCRYSDCRHINEKGCAVIQAVEDGFVSRKVNESYLKFRKEAWHYNASIHEKQQYERSFSKMIKRYKNKK